jgi:hypothetical protein
VSGCGMTVHNGTVAMVRDTEVSSHGGVVVMGTDGVTMLHPQEMGKSELPPPLEVVSPSLTDSSRIVCRDSDLL